MVITTSKGLRCNSQPYQRNQRRDKWRVVPTAAPRTATTVHLSGRSQYPQGLGRSRAQTSYPAPCALPHPPSADNISPKLDSYFGLELIWPLDQLTLFKAWLGLCFSQACWFYPPTRSHPFSQPSLKTFPCISRKSIFYLYFVLNYFKRYDTHHLKNWKHSLHEWNHGRTSDACSVQKINPDWFKLLGKALRL